ncbi:MAG: alpha/beta hydrolase [Cyanobacteria bacterium QS_8_64_29]|nr:MAG: alpha/beta hydrolase [Cyanobacteria bacterium QS_8_64_29]
MPPVRRTLALPQLRLSYLEWNPGGVPLLLLHGLADCAAVWCCLGEALGDRYHVVAPDLRGHGDSDKPARGYGFAELMGDLEALFDALGWSAADALGHSWTGKLLPLWAQRSPHRLRRLVLVDPFYIGRLPGWLRLTFPLLYRTLPFLQGLGPYASYERAQQQARRMKQYRGWSCWQQQAFRASLERGTDGWWRRKFALAARDEAFAEVLQVAGLRAPLPHPTLLLIPERGLNRMVWQLAPLRRHADKLQVRSVPGNHWAFLVAPAAFEQAVRSFLEGGR